MSQLKTGLLILVLLASTTVAVEGITETLPKISQDSTIDESLWAMSKDENLSYKSCWCSSFLTIQSSPLQLLVKNALVYFFPEFPWT
jgi:hypothetical protein